MDTFSERNGFAPADVEIITRDAPLELRSNVVDLAYEAGMSPSQIRAVICRTLFVAPNLNNWTAFPNIDMEVRGLIANCAWFDVYDIIEAIATDMPDLDLRQPKGLLSSISGMKIVGYSSFETQMNHLFHRRGIGWQLVNRKVEYRGSTAIEQAIQDTGQLVKEAGLPTAAKELHEAIRDLGRRPDPEVTGAIQHAMAALECVARDRVASKQTLGDLIRGNRAMFPAPLDLVVEKAWGYTSNFGRHLQEGRPPTFDEAELMVGVAAVLARYLARKNFPTPESGPA